MLLVTEPEKTHLSHIYEMLSAYPLDEQNLAALENDIRDAQKEANKTSKAVIVSHDSVDHILIVYPSGSASLYRKVQSYNVDDSDFLVEEIADTILFIKKKNPQWNLDVDKFSQDLEHSCLKIYHSVKGNSSVTTLTFNELIKPTLDCGKNLMCLIYNKIAKVYEKVDRSK